MNTFLRSEKYIFRTFDQATRGKKTTDSVPSD